MGHLSRDACVALLAFLGIMLVLAVVSWLGYDAWTTNP
jgi:hypothetical protein